MGVHDYIPHFQQGDLYTYFTSLMDGRGLGNVPFEKRQLAKAAKSALTRIEANNLQEGTQTVQTAIDFLAQAAQSERNKELNAIIQYKTKLKNELKDWENAPRLAKIIDELESINLDNADFDTYQTFNARLTDAINFVKQQQNTYLAQLMRLRSTIDQKFTTTDIRDHEYIYRAYGDAESLLNDLTGMMQKEVKDEVTPKISVALRKSIEDYISKNIKNINNLLSSNLDKADFILALSLQIGRYAQEELDRLCIEQGTVQDMTVDIVQEGYNKFLQAVEKGEDKLIKVFHDQSKEFYDILDGIQKAYGTKENKSLKKIQQKQVLSEQRLAFSKGKQKNQGAKQLIKSAGGRKLLNDLLTVEINSRTNTSHGGLGEAIKPLVERAIVTQGRTAADVISLGTLEMDFEVESNQAAALAYVRNITNEIEHAANTNVLNDRFSSNAKMFSEMSDNIEETIKELEKLVKLDPKLDQLFIFHENIKTYAQVSQGINDKFHGREMAIFTAFDELYSMAGTNGMQFAQLDALKLVALNLSSGALGASLKPSLENYLSIFAGLLMFDDIKNMSMDIGKNLIDTPVQQIHVYSMNNIYVPSSVVLTNISLALQGGLQNLTSDAAAKVTINTSAVDAAIAAYPPGPKYDRDWWPKYAEIARAGTLVRITFLSSFMNFLQTLINL